MDIALKLLEELKRINKTSNEQVQQGPGPLTQDNDSTKIPPTVPGGHLNQQESNQNSEWQASSQYGQRGKRYDLMDSDLYTNSDKRSSSDHNINNNVNDDIESQTEKWHQQDKQYQRRYDDDRHDPRDIHADDNDDDDDVERRRHYARLEELRYLYEIEKRKGPRSQQYDTHASSNSPEALPDLKSQSNRDPRDRQYHDQQSPSDTSDLKTRRDHDYNPRDRYYDQYALLSSRQQERHDDHNHYDPRDPKHLRSTESQRDRDSHDPRDREHDSRDRPSQREPREREPDRDPRNSRDDRDPRRASSKDPRDPRDDRDSRKRTSSKESRDVDVTDNHSYSSTSQKRLTERSSSDNYESDHHYYDAYYRHHYGPPGRYDYPPPPPQASRDYHDRYYNDRYRPPGPPGESKSMSSSESQYKKEYPDRYDYHDHHDPRYHHDPRLIYESESDRAYRAGLRPGHGPPPPSPHMMYHHYGYSYPGPPPPYYHPGYRGPLPPPHPHGYYYPPPPGAGPAGPGSLGPGGGPGGKSHHHSRIYHPPGHPHHQSQSSYKGGGHGGGGGHGHGSSGLALNPKQFKTKAEFLVACTYKYIQKVGHSGHNQNQTNSSVVGGNSSTVVITSQQSQQAQDSYFKQFDLKGEKSKLEGRIKQLEQAGIIKQTTVCQVVTQTQTVASVTEYQESSTENLNSISVTQTQLKLKESESSEQKGGPDHHSEEVNDDTSGKSQMPMINKFSYNPNTDNSTDLDQTEQSLSTELTQEQKNYLNTNNLNTITSLSTGRSCILTDPVLMNIILIPGLCTDYSGVHPAEIKLLPAPVAPLQPTTETESETQILGTFDPWSHLTKYQKHRLGLCCPCYFKLKAHGCEKGESKCNFCHYCSLRRAYTVDKWKKKKNAFVPRGIGYWDPDQSPCEEAIESIYENFSKKKKISFECQLKGSLSTIQIGKTGGPGGADDDFQESEAKKNRRGMEKWEEGLKPWSVITMEELRELESTVLR